MLWKALTTQTIWATYFKAKHLSCQHLSKIDIKKCACNGRMDWLAAKDKILKHSRFFKGPRLFSFWKYTWLGDKPLRDLILPSQWGLIEDKNITIQDLSNTLNPSWNVIRHVLP